MKVSRILGSCLLLMPFSFSACQKHEEHVHHEPHKVVATTPEVKDVTIVQPYVCQIHSQQHTEIKALERGYLENIPVKEGQAVKEGDPLFQVLANIYKAELDAAVAEADVAKQELENQKALQDKNVVSQKAVNLLVAKYNRAVANVEKARAEMNFTSVKAPFDGIIDRLVHQKGSLVDEGDVLTTLSDNRVMWVYFNMPEKRYLEYKADLANHKDELSIELVLANHETFPHPGKISAIEADFNNETGNIAFRADFPNPEGLLRNGQTGKILIKRVAKDAIVIPQRATFDILNKRYVYVLDEDKVAHQREIVTEHVLDDIYVIKEGLAADDTIVLEGTRQVRDGDEVEFELKAPEAVLANLKYHAE